RDPRLRLLPRGGGGSGGRGRGPARSRGHRRRDAPPRSHAGAVIDLQATEAIVRGDDREISILVAREDLTIMHSRSPAGERVAGLHVHHEHTDAFYVLEGELTFEVGREEREITV